jgi:hypothetical protein
LSAKANYRKAQALYDLDLHVKKSVSGMRPDVGNAAQAAKNPETVDPKKLFARGNSLYDSGRLQEALGEQGADALLEHVNDHLIGIRGFPGIRLSLNPLRGMTGTGSLVLQAEKQRCL